MIPQIVKPYRFRRLNMALATTLDVWLRHNEYDPQTMNHDQMIGAARAIRKHWSEHFITGYSITHIALGILALQNGGEL